MQRWEIAVFCVWSLFPLGCLFTVCVYLNHFIFLFTKVLYLAICSVLRTKCFVFLIFNTWCNRSRKDVPLYLWNGFCIPINSSLKAKSRSVCFCLLAVWEYSRHLLYRELHPWLRLFSPVSDSHLNEWKGLRKHAGKCPFLRPLCGRLEVLRLCLLAW